MLFYISICTKLTTLKCFADFHNFMQSSEYYKDISLQSLEYTRVVKYTFIEYDS